MIKNFTNQIGLIKKNEKCAWSQLIRCYNIIYTLHTPQLLSSVPGYQNNFKAQLQGDHVITYIQSKVYGWSSNLLGCIIPVPKFIKPKIWILKLIKLPKLRKQKIQIHAITKSGFKSYFQFKKNQQTIDIVFKP